MTAQPLSAAEQARLDAIEAAPAAEESLRERVALAIWDTTMLHEMTGWAWQNALIEDDREFYREQADAAIGVLRGPSSDAEQALARVTALAGELATRYPDASPELQSILRAVAADIRTTIAGAREAKP